jgi:hypothetical protein
MVQLVMVIQIRVCSSFSDPTPKITTLQRFGGHQGEELDHHPSTSSSLPIVSEVF